MMTEDAIHQIAKLTCTNDTVEVKDLTQADIESILFTLSPICITYNRPSKVHVTAMFIIDISSSFCRYVTSWIKASKIYTNCSYFLYIKSTL